MPDLSAPTSAVEPGLRELGRNFANKARFWKELVGYVRGDRKLSLTLDRPRRDLSDSARLAYLQQQLPHVLGFGNAALIRDQIERVPRTYRAVLVLSILEFELLNGGLGQFFSNSSGALAEYAARALRDLGQDASAGALEQAIALFGSPYPVATEDRRRVYLAHEEVLDQRLAALEKRVDIKIIPAILIEAARRERILPD